MTTGTTTKRVMKIGSHTSHSIALSLRDLESSAIITYQALVNKTKTSSGQERCSTQQLPRRRITAIDNIAVELAAWKILANLCRRGQALDALWVALHKSDTVELRASHKLKPLEPLTLITQRRRASQRTLFIEFMRKVKSWWTLESIISSRACRVLKVSIIKTLPKLEILKASSMTIGEVMVEIATWTVTILNYRHSKSTLE